MWLTFSQLNKPNFSYTMQSMKYNVNDFVVYNKVTFQEKYIVVPSDKAYDNIIFVCEVHYLFSMFDQRVRYQWCNQSIKQSINNLVNLQISLYTAKVRILVTDKSVIGSFYILSNNDL